MSLDRDRFIAFAKLFGDTKEDIAPLCAEDRGSRRKKEFVRHVDSNSIPHFSDEDLARLLNWVLTEFAETPPDPAYSAQEIRILRAEPLRDGPRGHLLAEQLPVAINEVVHGTRWYRRVGCRPTSLTPAGSASYVPGDGWRLRRYPVHRRRLPG